MDMADRMAADGYRDAGYVGFLLCFSFFNVCVFLQTYLNIGELAGRCFCNNKYNTRRRLLEQHDARRRQPPAARQHPVFICAVC